MTGIGWNEYHALWAFCLGAAAQSFGALRSRKDVLRALAAALAAGAGSWLFNRGGDQAFGLPLGWVILYVLFHSLLFSRRGVPVLTPAAVLHFVFPAYYALHTNAERSGADLPWSVAAAGSIPGLFLLAGAVLGWYRRAWFRVLGYAAYLVSLAVLIAVQWSPEELVEVYERSGYSLALYLYVFTAGAVFVVFAHAIVQLVLLAPFQQARRSRSVLRTLLGPMPWDTAHGEFLATRFGRVRPDGPAWVLLAANLALLLSNARWQWVEPGLLVNGIILAVTWVVIPWDPRREAA